MRSSAKARGGTNVCDFEKRVCENYRNVYGCGWISFRKRAEASRESSWLAHWMSDLARQGNVGQGFSGHDQATGRRWISECRVVLALRLRRPWFRRARQIQASGDP